MPPNCTAPHFFTPHRFSSVEFGITRKYIRVGFGMQAAETSCADFNFLLHYVSTIHQRNRQTDRRTDGRHARSISAKLLRGVVLAVSKAGDLIITQYRGLRGRGVYSSWLQLHFWAINWARNLRRVTGRWKKSSVVYLNAQFLT